MVHLCFHFMGYSPPPPFSIFSFFCKGDFLAMSLSLFGGGPLGLLDLDLPQIVCAVKASTSHEGHFLSTAEDSKTDRTSQSPILYSNQTTHMPNI